MRSSLSARREIEIVAGRMRARDLAGAGEIERAADLHCRALLLHDDRRHGLRLLTSVRRLSARFLRLLAVH
jgi:hypothetical protein